MNRGAEAEPLTANRGVEEGRNLQRQSFMLGAGLALAAVLALGWLTGLRGALHALALLSGAVALLPFLFLSAAVLLVVGASLLGALAAPDTGIFTAGAVDGIATGGNKLVRAYYGLLWRLRRHPLAWGTGVGVLLGALALLGVLWLFVVPRETQTLGILLEAQAQLDAQHRATRRYPATAEDGYLRAKRSPAEGEPGAAASDGFGRPILYRRDGAWLTASYTLTSLGYDGKPSGDDICVTGRTHVRQLMDRLREPMQVLSALRAGTMSFAEQTGALRKTRCSRLTEDAPHELTGAEAMKVAGNILLQAHPLIIPSALGPVKLVPGTVWAGRRMLLYAAPLYVYFSIARGWVHYRVPGAGQTVPAAGSAGRSAQVSR